MSSYGKEYPLLFPGPKNMKPEEFFKLRYQQIDINEDGEENPPPPNLVRTCLNDAEIGINMKNIKASNPEELVRSLLNDVLVKIRKPNLHSIGYYEALSQSYEVEIQNVFDKTRMLRYVDLSKLNNVEQTTCFLVNLTNLMWIHALFSFNEDFHIGLCYKNWCLRHIYYNMIGYKIGDKGFISLFDLHSTLLNYPTIFRTNALDSFDFIQDARLHSVICQPYIFSPKVTVLVPEKLEEDLTSLQNEYIRHYIIVDSYFDLLIPVPMVMQMERSSYNHEVESENTRNVDGIPEKFNLLVDVLKERGFPYFDLLSKDIYMMVDAQFSIKFEYDPFDIENVTNTHKMMWKCCRFHKSLYDCLQHHASLARSTLADEHLSVQSVCRCYDKSGTCINTVLCKTNELYNPMLNDYNVTLNFDNNGLRCLYAAISFAVGIKKKKQRPELPVDADHEFLLMLQIVESLYLSVPTAKICNKIKLCTKIFLIANEMYERWPKWYTIFISEPSDILSFINDHGDYKLADEWISVTLTIEPGFTFTLEAYSKYLLMLCDIEDLTPLKKALTLTNGLPISDICDYVVKNYFSPARLINLLSTVIESNYFNNTESLRFYPLLVGLKMINVMPTCEQAFYYDIAYHPLLIVEQLILNKKIATLKMVLNEAKDFIATLPENIQKFEALSRDEMDQMLRDYATKALHFRKKPAPTDCLNAALLHAEIFKEGQFYPPDQVPPSNRWIPNNWVSKCMCCKKTEFNVFVRRHHCRRCGRVVCDACSSKRTKVITYRGLVRVCDQCYEFESQYENTDDSISENSTATDDSMRKPVWKLTADSDMNVLIRQQSGFDSAPDIELCLSILELHTENIAVPRFLFTQAESLIKILRQRLICPANFDYAEVTHIVRSLLLAGKLYYTHLGETNGMKRCEELTSEVDILNQLSKIKIFPADNQRPIRDIQELKKIRDTVLERQQWELALEISTKIGLECNSIWYLWGIALLKSGDYAAARDKISRSNIKKNPAMLNDILDVLYAIAERETPRSFTDLFRLNKTSQAIPDHIIEQCTYYAVNYATPQQLFEFYAKHDKLPEAVQLTFDKKIPPKDFVDRIFAPYMRVNDYLTVLRSMKNVDRSLQGWKDYINEIGVHCKKNNLFSELYEIQKWANDYFRAAISCTIFYSQEATTYGQLLKREEHLLNAISHMKILLDKTEVNKRTPIAKQLICLSMQLDVTKMITSNTSCANFKFTQVPTLLGTESEKCEVFCLLFDSQKDFKLIFALIEKIISEFSLNMMNVYMKLAEHFMLKNQPTNILALIKCFQEAKLDRQDVIDQIASVALRKGAQPPEDYLRYIVDTNQKIEMLLISGRLKTAYMLVIRVNKFEYLEKIAKECQKVNMSQLEIIVRRKINEIKSS